MPLVVNLTEEEEDLAELESVFILGRNTVHSAPQAPAACPQTLPWDLRSSPCHSPLRAGATETEVTMSVRI